MKKILALVPARGGSKGVPDKNLRPLNGKSLLQRTFEVLQASGLELDSVVSTDSEAIRDHAKELGFHAPFLRPAELSGDSSAMIDVVLHALENLVQTYDAVMLLQPTSPLRKSHHLVNAVESLQGDSVVSVVPIPLTHCPHYAMRITAEGHLDYFLEEGRNVRRRQDVVPAYTRDGTLYLTMVHQLVNHRDFYGQHCTPLLIDPADSLSIDTEEDWILAEQRLREREP